MNQAVFLGHLESTHVKHSSNPPPEHTLCIRGSNMSWTSNNRTLSEGAKKKIYEKVGDYKISRNEDKFWDPFLKLYIGAPVMLLDNTDVPNGEANGTRATVKRVILRRGKNECVKQVNIEGYSVNVVEAHDVKAVLLEMKCKNGATRIIRSEPLETKCTVQMPMQLVAGGKTEEFQVGMKMLQFSFIMNHATTVHKLQGQTVENLYIVNWSYKANWIYVALSRVKTLKGLFLRKKIDRRKNLRPRGELLAMLRKMETINLH